MRHAAIVLRARDRHSAAMQASKGPHATKWHKRKAHDHDRGTGNVYQLASNWLFRNDPTNEDAFTAILALMSRRPDLATYHGFLDPDFDPERARRAAELLAIHDAMEAR
jgi:hypothetical protein